MALRLSGLRITLRPGRMNVGVAIQQELKAVNLAYLVQREMEAWYEHRHKTSPSHGCDVIPAAFFPAAFCSPSSLFPAEEAPPEGISGRRKAHRPVLRLPVLLRSSILIE